MKTTTSLITSLFALTASAQNTFNPEIGPFSAGPANTPAQQQLYQAANSTESNSVTFSQTFNGNTTNWTWITGVKNISVPNRLSDFGNSNANSSQGLHLINTVWNLQWSFGPSDTSMTLDQYLEANNATIYVNALMKNLPASVVSRYSQNDNGNCNNLLTTDCVNALSSAAATGGAINFNDLGAVCQSTLNAQAGGLISGVGFEIDRTVPYQGTTTNDTLLYIASGESTNGNATLLRQAESALQLITLDFKSGLNQRAQGSGPAVVCRIIDASAQTGAGVSWRPSVSMVWGVLLMGALMLWQ